MPDDASAAMLLGIEFLDTAREPVGLGPDVRPARLPRTLNKRSPTHTDAAVGRRIRDLRTSMGMPLAELSGLIGVSQPQLYRYESGLTRVAASRLIAIAAALGVSVEALASGGQAMPSRQGGGGFEVDLLLRAFGNIARPERRSALIALARSMAETDIAEPG
jgi:transcriptional regulator with XRE-family HTH domain